VSEISDEAMIARLEREAGKFEREVATLTAERDRLRARIHEAVDECQRRYGPVESQLAKLRGLMREALRRHNDEMATLGNAPNTYISGYGQAAAAAILEERDALTARLAQAERVVEAARKLITWWVSVAAEAHDDPAQTHPLTPLRLAVDALDGTAGPGEEGGDG